jgi:hypothetical protein
MYLAAQLLYNILEVQNNDRNMMGIVIIYRLKGLVASDGTFEVTMLMFNYFHPKSDRHWCLWFTFTYKRRQRLRLWRRMLGGSPIKNRK